MFENVFIGAAGQTLGLVACPHLYNRVKKVFVYLVKIKWLQYIKEHRRCLDNGSYYLCILSLVSHICLLISHDYFIQSALEYSDRICQMEPQFSPATPQGSYHFLLFMFLWVEDGRKVLFWEFPLSELAFPVLCLAITGLSYSTDCLEFWLEPRTIKKDIGWGGFDE